MSDAIATKCPKCGTDIFIPGQTEKKETQERDVKCRKCSSPLTENERLAYGGFCVFCSKEPVRQYGLLEYLKLKFWEYKMHQTKKELNDIYDDREDSLIVYKSIVFNNFGQSVNDINTPRAMKELYKRLKKALSNIKNDTTEAKFEKKK